MSNWEDKYNKYKDGGIDNELNKIVNRADTGKLDDYAEYDHKEYDKLMRIKKNMPQVAHIVEYRDKLKNELQQLQAELETRKALAEASKKIEKLGKEIDKLQEQSEKVAKQLRDPKLSDEKRAELQAEQDKIGPEMAKKQDGIQQNENVLNNALGSKRKLQDLSEEEIRKEIELKNNKITQYEFVANMLVNGNDWDLIEEKLDSFQNRKFTSKDGKLKEKIENKKDEPVAEKENKEDKAAEELKKQREEKVKDFIENYNPDFENNKPELTFADKHPRLAKIGKFFKGIKDKLFKKEKDEVVNTETKDPVEKEEKEENENKQQNSFREDIRFIKEVAEKGIGKIEAEKAAEEAEKAAAEKAARREKAMETLEKWRKANRENERRRDDEEAERRRDISISDRIKNKVNRNDDEGR